MPETFTLPDGRTIDCINSFNAAGVWAEFEDGLYAGCLERLQPSDTVIDVGAHVGLTALLVTDRAPTVGIIACEPAPPTFACLRANAARYMPNVVPVNKAVGAEPGTSTLTYYPNSEVMTTLHVDDADDRRNIEAALDNMGVTDAARRESVIATTHAGATEFTVPVTTVADLVEEFPMGEIGLLKIDVERAEFDVLRGIGGEDNWRRIRTILAEVHDIDGRMGEWERLLHAKGFDIDAVQQDTYSGGTTSIVTASRRQ